MSGVRIPRPIMRAEFRKRLRADLMNEAVALAEERRWRGTRSSARISMLVARLRPVAVAAVIVAVLLAGAGAAAAGSLPGDPGYGLKRAAEAVELALAPTAEAKLSVLATQAQRRLDDLTRTASERPDRAPTATAEYEAAVQRFAAAVEALRAAEPGTKHDAVDELVESTRAKHEAILEELEQRVPASAQPGIERAIEEHEKLRPSAAPSPDERGGKPSDVPSRSGEPARSPSPNRPSEKPRADETSRGDRPSALPTPHR